jgi:hypothetical protein
LSAPTVDAMRARLGGRVGDRPGRPGVPSLAMCTEPPPRVGSVVTVHSAAGSPRLGVLVAAESDTADVCFDRGLVKRTSLSALAAHAGEAPRELAALAEQANVFAALYEGQEVNVERHDGRTQRGILREKCRYGALVETDEGTVLGVGFGKLWPAAERSTDN